MNKGVLFFLIAKMLIPQYKWWPFVRLHRRINRKINLSSGIDFFFRRSSFRFSGIIIHHMTLKRKGQQVAVDYVKISVCPARKGGRWKIVFRANNATVVAGKSEATGQSSSAKDKYLLTSLYQAVEKVLAVSGQVHRIRMLKIDKVTFPFRSMEVVFREVSINVLADKIEFSSVFFSRYLKAEIQSSLVCSGKGMRGRIHFANIESRLIESRSVICLFSAVKKQQQLSVSSSFSSASFCIPVISREYSSGMKMKTSITIRNSEGKTSFDATAKLLNTFDSFVDLTIRERESVKATLSFRHRFGKAAVSISKWLPEPFNIMLLAGDIAMTYQLWFSRKNISDFSQKLLVGECNLEDISPEAADMRRIVNDKYRPLQEVVAAKGMTVQQQELFHRILIFCEDPNFFKHKGVDVYYLTRALLINSSRRKYVLGGSTITMQLTRNLLLGHKREMGRKLQEIIISLLIENVYNVSKDDILGRYLEIIEFGPGIYGLYNATEFYFGKQLSEITTLEFVVLTYVIPRPSTFYRLLNENAPLLFEGLAAYVREKYLFLHHYGILDTPLRQQKNMQVFFSSRFKSVLFRA